MIPEETRAHQFFNGYDECERMVRRIEVLESALVRACPDKPELYFHDAWPACPWCGGHGGPEEELHDGDCAWVAARQALK